MTSKEKFLAAVQGKKTDRPAIGTPTSIVCLDLMAELGVYFPDGHLNADSMAALASAGHTVMGFDNVMPLFSVCHESASVGVETNWGEKDIMPSTLAASAGFPINSGVILSSGNITNAIGPNNSSLAETIFGLAGDTDLNSLVGTNDTHDAAVLEFDIVATNSLTLTFQYIYASEEYPEYIGAFNDPMAIFVSTNRVGTNWINSITNNIARVPGTNVPVSVNNINGGCVTAAQDNGGDYIPPTNAQYYVDNCDPKYFAATNAAAAPVYNLQYDGFTTNLTAQVYIMAGVTNHVKIAIADYGDARYDSAVFIKAQTPCP